MKYLNFIILAGFLLSTLPSYGKFKSPLSCQSQTPQAKRVYRIVIGTEDPNSGVSVAVLTIHKPNDNDRAEELISAEVLDAEVDDLHGDGDFIHVRLSQQAGRRAGKQTKICTRLGKAIGGAWTLVQRPDCHGKPKYISMKCQFIEEADTPVAAIDQP